MNNTLKRSDRLAVIRIVAIYATLAAFWIYFSDTVLGILVHDPELLVRIAILKGFLFITVTGTTLYLLIASYLRQSRQTDQKLNESRILITSLIENTTDAIFLKDIQGRYLLFNSAAEKITGKPASEVLGKDDTAVFLPDDARTIIEGDRKVLESGRVMTYEDYATVPGGRTLTFLATKGPLVDANGVVCGLFGISRDISDRKLIEQELREKSDEQENFIHTIAHDLKSPLITITTFLRYLEQDLPHECGSRVGQNLHFIRSAADKIKRMLDELLEFSRLGHVHSQPSCCTFRELIEEALHMVAGSIAERRIKVVLSDAPISLSGDRFRLVQIWQNLLENAIKFMGDQAEPCIEIGAEQEGRDTVFFVRDNGIGLDPQFRERVFGLFVKLDPNVSGTGLGLSMIRRIVALYGGAIRLESPGPGHGTCARFTLPAAVSGSEQCQEG